MILSMVSVSMPTAPFVLPAHAPCSSRPSTSASTTISGAARVAAMVLVGGPDRAAGRALGCVRCARTVARRRRCAKWRGAMGARADVGAGDGAGDAAGAHRPCLRAGMHARTVRRGRAAPPCARAAALCDAGDGDELAGGARHRRRDSRSPHRARRSGRARRGLHSAARPLPATRRGPADRAQYAQISIERGIGLMEPERVGPGRVCGLLLRLGRLRLILLLGRFGLLGLVCGLLLA